MLLRRKMARLAGEAAIGPLRRVHRTRTALASNGKVWLLLGGGLLATTIYFNVGATLAYAVGALAVLVYVYLVFFADTGVPAGRYWIGVADGGLVVAPQHGTIAAVPWQLVRHARLYQPTPGSAAAVEIVIEHPSRTETIRFGEIGGRRDLITAINERRAIRPPMLLRSVFIGGAVVAVLIVVWIAFLPDFLVRSQSMPADTDVLSRACERAGAKYPAAAAFTGSPPHPILAFLQDGREYQPTSAHGATTPPAGFSENDPARVQLVACIRRTGADSSAVTSCTYQEQFGSRIQTRSMLSATYTVDVYELRTHRKVGTAQLVGDNTTCPNSVFGGNSDDDLYSKITGAAVQQVLEPFVNRH